MVKIAGKSGQTDKCNIQKLSYISSSFPTFALTRFLSFATSMADIAKLFDISKIWPGPIRQKDVISVQIFFIPSRSTEVADL